ncbi:hypothetical protein [Aliiroseovarius sediminis]|uniref:hypothetical protein n=1 Tax=Aliiroseovarius sediminis TaxID=2925839 RepID=UPI001F57B514|nr:hypothetical protein [Aliiroseovarius sediminis]MCI2395955.1 hypothetical protein [Aliiroseovarius sediminis]
MKKTLMKGICLAALLAAPITALAEDAAPGAAPLINEYALIFPANMPHLMATIGAHRGELDLTEAQSAEVDAIFAEVPARIKPLFTKAKELETVISNDVMAGALLEGLGPQLDELAAVKREAAEVHIACINRVRSMLSPEQYAKVLELAGHAGKGV